MTVAFIGNQTLTTETCCACGLLFAMPSELNAELRRSHNTFFCPVGHRQHYLAGSSEESKLRNQLARERARLDQVKCELRDTENRRRAEKAAKTRIKNRVSKGVCPCCNRTFQNLCSHMKSQHPEWAATE